MTARWVVDEVVPHRDVVVKWEPISLLFKNEPAEDSPYYEAAMFSHRLLRVMVAISDNSAEGRKNSAEGSDNSAVQRAYWEFASRIHNDGSRDFTAAEALEAAGLDPAYAAAADDESYDDEIRSRMDAGLALTGTDVGTPLIALDDHDGNPVGLFGPVISQVPSTELSLELWDGFVKCARVPGFWELKRTRTENPDFGERPTP